MDRELKKRLLRMSAEMGFEPYKFTPFKDSASHLGDNNSSAGSPDSPDDSGAEGLPWCTCGLCRDMPTPLEQVCCRDLPEIVAVREDGYITEHEHFTNICFRPEVLRVMYWEMQLDGVDVEDDEEVHSVSVHLIPDVHALDLADAWEKTPRRPASVRRLPDPTRNSLREGELRGLSVLCPLNAANSKYWSDLGKSHIEKKLRTIPNTQRARNVVLFLGDGMGISTVTAARIFKGQFKKKFSGEESVLSWERFPHVSLSKTYGLNVQTSDSANSATAYLCGVKANIGTVGVDSSVKAKQCHNDTRAYVQSVMKWAQDAGMWTGIVTTARVTDASPAGAYAHSGYRKWQHSVPKRCNARDIAQQLIYDLPGSEMRVILGGGRKVFLNSTKRDEEGKKGERTDGLNLIKKWKKLKEGWYAKYVWNRSGLLAVNAKYTDYLLGLFDSDHMPYWINRSRPDSTKPNLTEMVTVAIKLLSRNRAGFVLFAEGARIDHGHHINRAKLALQEALELDEAVKKTATILKEEETLIVVTADHSHTMTIAGYPPRGTNILGLAGNTTSSTPVEYTVLSYAEGPQGARPLRNMTEAETSHVDFVQQAAFPLRLAAHGGEDVAVYARGPWSHLFDGVNDQTYIPYVMAYAACIGRFRGPGCHQWKKR